MNNITDFLAYRESKKRVEELISSADISKLGQAELASLIQQIGRLVQQQSELLTTVLMDMGLLVQRNQEMQQQFMYVSGQAYIAVEILKEKGIATPEEVETAWQKVVQEKILAPQGLQEAPPDGELVTDVGGSIESDSSDLNQT